jgi:hypothetical protein
VPAEDVVDYLEMLLRRYLDLRDGDQTFPTFIAALDADELNLFAAQPELASTPA